MRWTVMGIMMFLLMACASTQTAEEKAPQATCETAVTRLLKLCAAHPQCKASMTNVSKAEQVAKCKKETAGEPAFLACVSTVERIEDIDQCQRTQSATKKTAEAIESLDRIYRASANYYLSPRVQAGTGLKIECQFPANQPMTPNVQNKACCGGSLDTDNDNRCDVNTSQWVSLTWSALNFQMNDQHYFGYSYESSGVGENARFTVTAHADLDCDGVLSTFQRFGYGTKVSPGECEMKESDALFQDKPQE